MFLFPDMWTVSVCGSIKDDGLRHKVTGVVRNLRSRNYTAGTMLLFDMEDTTGSIPVVVWNDAYEKFSDLFKDDGTYTLYSVQGKANPRNNNQVELKLYPDTRADAAVPLQLTETFRNIKDILDHPDLPVRAKVIIYNIGDKEMSKSEQSMRRCVFVDASGETTGFIVGDEAVDKDLINGVPARIVGRMSQKTNLFVNTVEVIEDDELSRFWANSSATHIAKRAKLASSVDATIGDLSNAESGALVNLTAVVRNASLTFATAGARIKHECTLVDPTMHAIDLAHFCEQGTECAWKVGDVIKVEAKLSTYNTKSLICNNVQVVEDSELSSWFQGLYQGTTFTELTFFR